MVVCFELNWAVELLSSDGFYLGGKNLVPTSTRLAETFNRFGFINYQRREGPTGDYRSKPKRAETDNELNLDGTGRHFLQTQQHDILGDDDNSERAK